MIPALAQWEITDKCNYRCPHCYHANPNNEFKELNEEEMWQIAQVIIDNQLFFITFTGGEPMIRKKLLIELARYLYDHNIILSLNTNLSLIDQDILAELKVHRMLISCPSTDPDIYRKATSNGDYAQFEVKLKMLIEASVSHTINMVISKLNHYLVRETALHLAELGVKKFAATPASVNAINPNFPILLSLEEVQQVVNDLIWAYEELGLEVDIMESIPKCIMPQKAFELELPFIFRSCHAGKRNGTISTNGDIRPCSHNPRVFGNILKEDIGKIWNRMHDWRETSGNFHTDCLGCDIFNNCGGGCRVDASIRKGIPNAKHPYMVKELSSSMVKPKTILLKPEAIIRPVRSFQSRPENGGWLIAPGSPRNIIQVNQILYDFLVISRNFPPMTIQSLAEKFNTSFEDQDFKNIITTLTRKQFFIIEH